MKGFKKFLAIALAATMTMSMLVACGNSASNNDGVSTPPAESEPTTGEAPAAGGDVVTLKWVTVGSGMPGNYDAWRDNINAYLAEKIGVNIDIEVIGWGDWDQRRNQIVSTNEPYDIMFTNNGTFANDVSIGAFMDISDLVNSAAPGLVSFIPADYWDACRVNGKLYAVPTYKDSSATNYFVYDKNLVEGTGLDYENAHTMDEVTPILKAMKDATGESVFILASGGMDFIYGSKYDDLSSGLPAIGVSYTGNEAKVVSVFEQADVVNDLKVLHNWYNDGLINSDAATLQEAPQYRPAFMAQGWPYAAVSTWGPNMGVDAVAIQYGDTVLSNSTVQGSMNCISAACAYPEKALEFLQLVNTDTKVRDALYFGLEGDNFQYVGDKVEKLNTDWTMAGYTQGTFFQVSMLTTEEVNQWDEVKALNQQAIGSPILGFSFDTTPIEDELAACIQIFTSYRPVLMTGTQEPESTIADMLKEMNDSGLQKIIDEAQSQIDAWK